MDRRRKSLLERVGRGGLVPDERLRRADLRLEKRYDKSRRQRRWLVLGVLLLGVLTWRALIPVELAKVTADNESQVRQAAESQLTGIQGINAFVNSQDLAKSVTGDLETAVGAKIDHHFWLAKIDIEVRAQQPAVRWQTNGIQYIVSDFGIVLSLANAERPELPIVFDESNLEVELKSAIVPKEFIDFVTGLDGEAARRGILIKEHYVNGSIREIKLVVEGLPYRITLSTKRSFSSQLDELGRLQAYFTTAGRQPREYADFRVPGRAYWR